jgi:hypothetical protein
MNATPQARAQELRGLIAAAEETRDAITDQDEFWNFIQAVGLPLFFWKKELERIEGAH